MIKYNFKEDIFSKIDTAEKAYWLGFLYADGSIHELYRNQDYQWSSFH